MLILAGGSRLSLGRMPSMQAMPAACMRCSTAPCEPSRGRQALPGRHRSLKFARWPVQAQVRPARPCVRRGPRCCPARGWRARARVASVGVTTTAPSNAISPSAASMRPAPVLAPPARPAAPRLLPVSPFPAVQAPCRPLCQAELRQAQQQTARVDVCTPGSTATNATGQCTACDEGLGSEVPGAGHTLFGAVRWCACSHCRTAAEKAPRGAPCRCSKRSLCMTAHGKSAHRNCGQGWAMCAARTACAAGRPARRGRTRGDLCRHVLQLRDAQRVRAGLHQLAAGRRERAERGEERDDDVGVVAHVGQHARAPGGRLALSGRAALGATPHMGVLLAPGAVFLAL